MSSNEKKIHQSRKEQYGMLASVVELLGEAQNAYDFHAYAQALQMRQEAMRKLRDTFALESSLRILFPEVWLLAQQNQDVEFSAADLEQVRAAWLAEI